MSVKGNKSVEKENSRLFAHQSYSSNLLAFVVVRNSCETIWF